MTEQRIATCAFSINAVITPICYICFAIIAILLIIVVTLAIRNHCRDQRQTIKMIQYSRCEASRLTNGTMLEELNTESWHHGIMVQSVVTTRTAASAGQGNKAVRWHHQNPTPMGRIRQLPSANWEASYNKDSGEIDNAPVGKTGITTAKMKGQERSTSSSEFGSTPTPGASAECSLGLPLKNKRTGC